MERGLGAKTVLPQQLRQHRRHDPVKRVAAGDAQHASFGAPNIGEIRALMDLSLRRGLRCRLAFRSVTPATSTTAALACFSVSSVDVSWGSRSGSAPTSRPGLSPAARVGRRRVTSRSQPVSAPSTRCRHSKRKGRALSAAPALAPGLRQDRQRAVSDRAFRPA